jgi:hypothetical protein
VRKARPRIEPAFAAVPRSYDARETRSFDRKDSVASLCVILAAAAIITNALFLQRGPHPAPILVNKTPVRVVAPAAPAAAVPESTGAVVLPRPHPAKLETVKPEPAKLEAVKSEPVRAEPLPAKSDALTPPRPVRTIPLHETKPEANASRPPDPIGEIITPPARRVAAVQRVLSEYGYGQIKPTGTFDRETQDAIEQFERAKKLTVTRQITPVLMRELASLAGRPLE